LSSVSGLRLWSCSNRRWWHNSWFWDDNRSDLSAISQLTGALLNLKSREVILIGREKSIDDSLHDLDGSAYSLHLNLVMFDQVSEETLDCVVLVVEPAYSQHAFSYIDFHELGDALPIFISQLCGTRCGRLDLA